MAVLEALGIVLGVKAVPDMMAALGSTDLQSRTAAARIAIDLAARLEKTQPAEAGKLAAKILDATKEGTVRQRAQSLLGKSGK